MSKMLRVKNVEFGFCMYFVVERRRLKIEEEIKLDRVPKYTNCFTDTR